MKLTIPKVVLGAAVVFLSASPTVTHKVHRHLPNLERSFEHLHVRRVAQQPSAPAVIKERGGQCQFPTDDPNLVAVTPDQKNGGWAMSPDQECKPGSYCPFACKPGMVMNQWEPDSTYNYPSSMNGGLYCNNNGEIEKPFTGKPNCVQGSGAVEVVNKCSSHMSWCQTVLPGNEAMLIPTVVSSSATLAVPDSSYWCSTAAHFYINPPGTGEEGCIWGSDSNPVGNWSPYVAGANTESDGKTYVKLGWNPIWEDSGLKSTLPEFGVAIICPDGGCNGLPCKIDPSDGEGKVSSDESANGAGGSAFCVVTVDKGVTAQIIAFEAGSNPSSGGSNTKSATAKSSTAVPTTSTAQPTTSTSTTTSTTTTTTTSEVETTSTTSTTSTTPTPTSTSIYTSTYTPSFETSTSSVASTTTKTLKGGIFQENGTSTYYYGTTTQPAATTADLAEATATTSKENEAPRQQGSAALGSLVVAFIAAACFF